MPSIVKDVRYMHSEREEYHCSYSTYRRTRCDIPEATERSLTSIFLVNVIASRCNSSAPQNRPTSGNGNYNGISLWVQTHVAVFLAETSIILSCTFSPIIVESGSHLNSNVILSSYIFLLIVSARSFVCVCMFNIAESAP